MTGATAMATFTPEAEARLEEYCRQVRAAVGRDPEADPDEVEADIRAHIGVEFRSAPGPVGAVELEAVLARLGPPQGWGPAGDGGTPFDPWAPAKAVRRWAVGVVGTLYRGPEDWRLAYLTLILFALGVLTLPIGVGVLFLLGGYLTGRAAVELAKEKNAPLGARRWLVYPAVLAVSLPLFLGLMLWPLLAFGGGIEVVDDYKDVVRDARLAEDGHRPYRVPSAEQVQEANRVLDAVPGPRDWAEPVAGAFAAAGAASAWWTIAGLVMWAFPRWPVAVFHPLLDGYEGRHGLKLAGVAGLTLLIWLGFFVRFAERAGLS